MTRYKAPPSLSPTPNPQPPSLKVTEFEKFLNFNPALLSAHLLLLRPIRSSLCRRRRFAVLPRYESVINNCILRVSAYVYVCVHI